MLNNRLLRHILIWVTVSGFFYPMSVRAQAKSTRDTIRQAMKNEMARNLENLRLENLHRPFFISYTIRDVKTTTVTAVLGAIVQAEENRYRNHAVRVMVGDYDLTDENFLDFSGSSYRNTLLQNADELPIENDYNGIRRALWIATDNVYKSASEQYERKKAAIEQQNISEETKRLKDFTESPILSHTEVPRIFSADKTGWEDKAKELSALFKNYYDIYTSQVRISFYEADVFFINSEGTEIVQPLSLAAVQINASTQAVDGEPLTNNASFYGSVPEDIPSLEVMKKAVQSTAEELGALRTAPVFEGSYTGPVLLEGSAVAELFAQRLFTGTNGLLAHRKPMASDTRTDSYIRQTMGETLEEKMNLRILSRDLSIKAMPNLEDFAGEKLIGSYRVDAEGVRINSEILLVENGMLRSLLSNRTPTSIIEQSNGHERPIIGGGYLVSSGLGPSVISVSTSKGKSMKDMKKALLKLAREEGLDYAVHIRKLKPIITGADLRVDPMTWLTQGGGRQRAAELSEPILVYRVFVKDGREELVRSVNLGDVTLSALRHIVSASAQRFVYNTLVPAVGSEEVWYAYALRVSSQGIPSSFIIPHALLFEELDVKNNKRDFSPKLPVVPSPLAKE